MPQKGNGKSLNRSLGFCAERIKRNLSALGNHQVQNRNHLYVNAFFKKIHTGPGQFVSNEAILVAMGWA